MFLAVPDLVGDAPGGSVDAEVAESWSFVEPAATARVQVVPGGEFGALDEIVPDEAEGLLLLALAIWVADFAGEGIHAVVADEVSEAVMPQGLAPRAYAAEDRSRHVVQDQPMCDAVKVLEGAGKPLK